MPFKAAAANSGRWTEFSRRALLPALLVSIGWLPTATFAAANCTVAALQGSWQLHQAVYRDGAGKVVGEIKPGTTQSRKLLAGHHFSFITWQPDGNFEVAASGSFSTDDNGYHEQVDASSLPRLRGKSYHFRCALEGDRWLHQGMEDGIEIEEHWQRLSAVMPAAPATATTGG